ncbi:zinc finger protein 329-like isoform X1 [Contarinia nasturtii]|uniref:zinc finger protein 329-like isoform X1 n=1 Tax=Contarinia nasturtii TaxID=265458 RepID=UPI0012D421F0|nr:zinc finger protein 329-like isoform X1 [Contarinia nasturtii]XP_031639914.1 zinc finger protein 329-like isoform X1 [Contarinia nasturtii]XP_031639915.1 zinc finger protein 329-like isoform X1 [Contarinia nasturtii]
METKDCLTFVIETLSKVEVMVKILQNVATELHHQTQETENNRQPAPIASLSAMVNLYLDSAVIGCDSILGHRASTIERLSKQHHINAESTVNVSNIKALLENQQLGTNISAQFTSDSWIDRNIQINDEMSINTDVIPDSSILANNTNDFLKKVSQMDETETKETETKNDIKENTAVTVTNKLIENAVTTAVDATDNGKNVTKRTRRRIRISSKQRLSRRSIIIIKNRKSSIDASKPFRCPVNECNYKGARRPYLTKHMQTHSKEMKLLLACSVCPKLFRDQNAFNEHASVHDESPKVALESEQISPERKNINKDGFACKVCKKQFKQRGRLEKHLAVHEDRSKL